MSEKQILLFSGGLDSYIAYHFLNKPETVYFDLKTPYSDYEIRVIEELIPETIIDNSLTLASRQNLDSDTAFIPMRNLYLAMLACKYGDEIIICGLRDDNVNDKTPEMFEEFSSLLTELNGREIKVTSPFWNQTKADIVKWYLENVKDNDRCFVKDPKNGLIRTISCYTPTSVGDNVLEYCGKCRCCFRKWNALYVNGIKLPFYNLALMKEYLNRAKKFYYIAERNAAIIKAVEEYVSENCISYLGRTYGIDIDGILTNEIKGHDYENRTPNLANIKKVNDLFSAGDRIVLWSSRHPEDEIVTKDWLEKNGVKYDELILGKPIYDKIVDDKASSLDEL